MATDGRSKIQEFCYWLSGLVPQEWAGAVQLALDVVALWIALVAATFLRLEFSLHSVHVGELVAVFGVGSLTQGLGGYLAGLYQQRWRYGSVDEVRGLIQSAMLTTVVLVVAVLARGDRSVPVSAVIVGGFVAIVAMFAVRYIWRLTLDSGRRPDEKFAVRTIIFGAGEAGSELARSLKRNPRSPFLPVAVLDDDPSKQRQEVSRVRVQGTRHDLTAVAARTRATTLIIAIPSADAGLINDLNQSADTAGLDVKFLPPVGRLFGGPKVGDIRSLSEADLLGRRPVKTDLASIAGYLRGRRVLVTGAGGSIGSELCRQIKAFDPESLVMLDRDESALHGVQLSIEGRALLDSPNVVLADIRDPSAMRAIFRAHRPNVVFHAAALKHLPLLEAYPGEAIKSNIWGTWNVLQASLEVGVDQFVNVSTDKAANPVCVLGYSKRIAERLTAYVAGMAEHGTYLSVRFGNVLGSRGSVVPAFKAMIAAGGPVTVTSPDVTRYFMMIPEAVELVIQAGAIGSAGEVLVLDMGDPIRIDDVARLLVRESGKEVSIVYTGLRPGEKLHEDLLGTDELDTRPMHELISHATVPPLSQGQLSHIDPDLQREALVRLLRDLSIEPFEGHQA